MDVITLLTIQMHLEWRHGLRTEPVKQLFAGAWMTPGADQAKESKDSGSPLLPRSSAPAIGDGCENKLGVIRSRTAGHIL